MWNNLTLIELFWKLGDFPFFIWNAQNQDRAVKESFEKKILIVTTTRKFHMNGQLLNLSIHMHALLRNHLLHTAIN